MLRAASLNGTLPAVSSGRLITSQPSSGTPAGHHGISSTLQMRTRTASLTQGAAQPRAGHSPVLPRHIEPHVDACKPDPMQMYNTPLLTQGGVAPLSVTLPPVRPFSSQPQPKLSRPIALTRMSSTVPCAPLSGVEGSSGGLSCRVSGPSFLSKYPNSRPSRNTCKYKTG